MRACWVLGALLLGLLPAPAWPFEIVEARARSGNVYYLLGHDPDDFARSRIDRYDLTQETWLEPIRLPTLAFDFAVQDDALFVAFWNGTARYAPDGSAQVWFRPSAFQPLDLAVGGERVFGKDSLEGIDGLDRASGALLHRNELSDDVVELATVPGSGRLIGRVATQGGPYRLIAFDPAADGMLGEPVAAPLLRAPGFSFATFVLGGGQQLSDDTGTLYRGSDLAWLGNLH